MARKGRPGATDLTEWDRAPVGSMPDEEPAARFEMSRYWVRLLDQPVPNIPAELVGDELYESESDCAGP